MSGGDHAETLAVMSDFAGCLHDQGKHAEAGELLQGVLAAEQRTKGPGHADTLQKTAKLAKVHAAAREAAGPQ